MANKITGLKYGMLFGSMEEVSKKSTPLYTCKEAEHYMILHPYMGYHISNFSLTNLSSCTQFLNYFCYSA